MAATSLKFWCGGRRLAAVTLALAVLLHSAPCGATLENEMRGLFNSMTNVTDGGYHQGLGRGTVSGPSVVMRNKRVRTDLFNFVPPSINAGCGGIDMFLGSFSFIDADNFINLLQAVATNAAGYAFKLALETMCPTCGAAVTSLQRAVQALNAAAGDSCRLAKHAVDFMADKMGTAELAEQMEDGPLARLAENVGNKADAFASFLNKANTGSNTKALSENEVKALLGNVAWKVLQRNNFISTAFMSGNNELAEALMSVTGTIIGTKQGEDDTPNVKTYMPVLKVKDLLNGTTSGGDKLTRYHCANSDCTALTQVDYDFKGLERLAKEILLGADLQASGTDSFIYKLINNTGPLTQQEKQLIRVAPYHMTRLRNMAVCLNGGMGGLPDYVKLASRLIAIEVLDRYLKDALASIHQYTQGLGERIGEDNYANALVPKYLAELKTVSRDLNDEKAQLSASLTTDLEQIYQSAVKNCNLKPVQLAPHLRRQGG
jgi:conjugative transfer pilus assembly protein TraH